MILDEAEALDIFRNVVEAGWGLGLVVATRVHGLLGVRAYRRAVKGVFVVWLSVMSTRSKGCSR